ncbi:hypothetical protein MPSEU_000176400 [Mayamaea pseudoterrestris]|nr:hypothetical protein MPSEU_000176400 [Mayamaea pseudoterrestris]
MQLANIGMHVLLLLTLFENVAAFASISAPLRHRPPQDCTKNSVSTRQRLKLSRQPSTASSTQLCSRETPPTTTDDENISTTNDAYFDPKTPITYILGQSSLILLAVIVSALFQTPNYGCGPNIQFTFDTIRQGLVCTLPLAALAVLPNLLKLEDKFPALQQVTQATLKTVLVLLGAQWKPITALTVCMLLGLAAGFGEEMLFRGLLQYQLVDSWHVSNALAILLSSVIFGSLHAVTWLYAGLATVASFYFGYLYVVSDYNLAVPIVCHAMYDIGALLYAHWTVTNMSTAEQEEIMQWEPFAESSETTL